MIYTAIGFIVTLVVLCIMEEYAVRRRGEMK